MKPKSYWKVTFLHKKKFVVKFCKTFDRVINFPRNPQIFLSESGIIKLRKNFLPRKFLLLRYWFCMFNYFFSGSRTRWVVRIHGHMKNKRWRWDNTGNFCKQNIKWLTTLLSYLIKCICFAKNLPDSNFYNSKSS